MSRRYSLLVFDWDGTLMDSAATIVESLQEACRDLGLPVPAEERARHIIGMGLHDAMRYVLPFPDAGGYPRVVERYREGPGRIGEFRARGLRHVHHVAGPLGGLDQGLVRLPAGPFGLADHELRAVGFREQHVVEHGLRAASGRVVDERGVHQPPDRSLAKPLVYLAALETGRYTTVSMLPDEPVDLKLPNGDRWRPANFDKQLRGPVTIVRALTQSLNLPTVHLGLEVGLDRVARTFHELGLDEPPAELPSMLLGATNLSPMDVAQLYNTLANGGFRSPLRAVRAVVDESGQPLKAPELEVAQAIAPEAVYTLDRLLIEVMDRGTGRRPGQTRSGCRS